MAYQRNVVFCNKCVISNQRPGSSVEFKKFYCNKIGISFEEDGVYFACKFHDEKEKNINWEKKREVIC